MNTFFKGLKVIEIAGVLAGPSVGLFFAELGADVIKVENLRTNGDLTRHWKQENEDPSSSSSAYFACVNWNKKHIFLDLREEEDKLKLISMIEDADVLISNFKSNSAIKLGLDYKTLSKINTKLIYGQILGFPNEENRPAFDVVLQAETGFLSMSGTKNGELTKMPVALIDLMTAHQLKEAILIALLQRVKTKKGAYVSASLYESALASLANQASNYLNNNNIAKPLGTEHPNIAPYGEMLKTLDDKALLLAIGTELQFVKLCNTLELNELLVDEKYSSNTARIANRKSLISILETKISEQKLTYWKEIFNEVGIPFGQVKNMEEVLENKYVQEKMILSNTNDKGKTMKRLKSISFKIE